MPRDLSKTPGNRRNLVRQIKGPGMNLGLKKRHTPKRAKLKDWDLSAKPRPNKGPPGGSPMYSTLFNPVQQEYGKTGKRGRKPKAKGFF